jgi:hypothetical protein
MCALRQAQFALALGAFMGRFEQRHHVWPGTADFHERNEAVEPVCQFHV